MIALAGYTGFVGSNIYLKARNRIDGVFHSRNIAKAYGLEPELLIYAGLRADRSLAEEAPDRDLEQILQAEENIRRISPQKLVLISTADVYRRPVGVDESDSPLPRKADGGVTPYGLNRCYLESWVRRSYPDALIIRLPSLYGYRIRENFIYDYINVIPRMLDQEKYGELKALERAGDDVMLDECYERLGGGFYQCMELGRGKKELLKRKFKKFGFTALHFTDSRSTYQFYPLTRLWEDIQTALDGGLTLLNLATEPVSAGELYKSLTGEDFCNELEAAPAEHDIRTAHAALFGTKAGYIYGRDEILEDIRLFLKSLSVGRAL